MRPVVIQDGSDANELAQFDPLDRVVVFNQGRIIKSMREMYGQLNQSADINQTDKTASLWSNIARSKLFQALYLPDLPYRFIRGGPTRNFFPGDHTKVTQFIQKSRTGDLYPGLTESEKQGRIQRSLQKLTKLYTQRMGSWIFTHEYEHSHNFMQKTALKIFSPLLSFAISGSVLGELMKNMSPDVQVGALAVVAGTGLASGLAAKVYDEQASYDVADNNFVDIARAITINQDVFDAQILGIQAQ